jgi:hypothetical protein
MGGDLVATPEECEALVQVLAIAEPEVLRLRSAHEADYGELLVTVFLGELARWCFGGESSARLTAIVNHLLVAGSSPVRNVLLTGFVEGVPVDIDHRVLGSLGEPLQSEIRRDLGVV